MICLPDVNVWLALAVIEHEHYSAAIEWFESSTDELALCRVVQMGFLRLLTNPHVMKGDELDPAEAWTRLDRIQANARVLYAPEPDGLDHAWREDTAQIRAGSNFWTDAYLAAFARLTGYTLVTFDRGFAKYTKSRVRVLGRNQSR